MEAYLERIKSNAENLAKDVFPRKALELDDLINSDALNTQNISKIFDASNLPVPEDFLKNSRNLNTEHIETDRVEETNQAKKRKYEDQEISGSRVIFFESGAIQTNLKIVDLLKMIKPFIIHFLDSSALIKLWIQILIPQVEDFKAELSLQIQEDSLAEIRTIETEVAAYLDHIYKYHAVREMQSLNDMFNSLKQIEPNLNLDSCKEAGSLIHSNLSEVNHVKQLSLDIGFLFNNTDYCDIKLLVEGNEFKAHKIILAARSEYFRALLFSGMKETNCDTIEISEAKPGAFKLLLQYIYTGKISLRNEKEESIIDLLSLVHQYGFVELQKSISDYLESILDIRNVCSIYDISSLYQLKSLEETCARFIDRNCIVLIKQNTLLQLSCDSLAAIISRDSFSANEIEIFNIVKEWHEYNNVKEPKLKLIEKIRLPLMKLEEMLNEVRDSNLINSDKILDAIKLKTESNDMSLKYRGVLIPNENIATSRYQAIVINGEFKSALLDGDVVNYDFDRGFTYHPIDEAIPNSIIIKLGNPSMFNQIKLLLWDKDVRSYSYYIEISMNENDWVRILDYSNYLCRSWQNLYFKPVVARFIKIVGVRNTANRIFHLVSMEVRYTIEKYDLFNDLIVPHYNVASIMHSAVVFEGVSRTRNALINGDYKNYDWDSGYTCHQLGNGSINIQLAQPFVIGSMRLLLWDCDNRSYSYCIETSMDQSTWTMVADKRNEACRSWQILVFSPRSVSFIKITGTHNTANEVFHCVHFEAPCDSEVLSRYIEHENVRNHNQDINMLN